jgi:hypothetical protein
LELLHDAQFGWVSGIAEEQRRKGGISGTAKISRRIAGMRTAGNSRARSEFILQLRSARLWKWWKGATLARENPCHIKQGAESPVRVCAKMESVAATAANASQAASGTKELREKFERDPMVRAMLQRFGGKISEVKRREERP